MRALYEQEGRPPSTDLMDRGRTQSVDSRALRRLLVPGILLAVLVAELAILLTRSFTTGMGEDFTSFYVAALTWLHGYNPYSSQVPVHLAAIALLIPLLVLVLPYSHQYDSVILLPALAVTGHEAAPHVMTRVLFWGSVLLVTTTPVMALSTASIPFRLLPLGLVLWTMCGLMIERRRWHRRDHNRQLDLCVSRSNS